LCAKRQAQTNPPAAIDYRVIVGLKMNVGDRVVLSARVRLDVGEGVYAVDIPSYPALYRIRPRRKPKNGEEVGLNGSVVATYDGKVSEVAATQEQPRRLRVR